MKVVDISIAAMALEELLNAIDMYPQYGGFVTEEEWKNTEMLKYIIVRYVPEGNLKILKIASTWQPLAFHTLAQASAFMLDFKPTIKRYYMFNV